MTARPNPPPPARLRGGCSMPCSHASASASPRTGSSRSGSSPGHTYGASLADVAQRLDAEELFGQVMGLFELADGRGVAPFAVRVFNPTLAGDGYATVGSVVETNSEDMSFLVDSVSEELGARGLEIRLVVHPVIGVERDSEGGIAQVRHAREAEVRESVMHFEVGRHLPAEQLPELEARIRVVLMDVQAAVRDFKAMTDRVPELVEAARASTARYARDEIEETELFLWWLLDGNYVFLGARDYVLEGGHAERRAGAWPRHHGRDEGSAYASPVRLEAIDPGLRERLVEGNLLVVSKTNRFATVHRRVKMDDITVKRVGPDGTTVGALRLVGLFTGKAYMAPASRIPILSRKLRRSPSPRTSSKARTTTRRSSSSSSRSRRTSCSPRARRTSESSSFVCSTSRSASKPSCSSARTSRTPCRSARGAAAGPLQRRAAATPSRIWWSRALQRPSVDYHLSLGEEDQARIHFTVHVDGEIPEVSFAGPRAGGHRARAHVGRPSP